MQLDTWDDKDSGQKRSKLRVVAENMVMLGSGGKTNKPSEDSSPEGGEGEIDFEALSKEIPW